MFHHIHFYRLGRRALRFRVSSEPGVGFFRLFLLVFPVVLLPMLPMLPLQVF